MGIPQLRELAIMVTDRIPQNVSINWNLQEGARAKIKVMVKQLLRQYSYPPNMVALATELVWEQATIFVDFEISKTN
jgi:type I restriction enzyme R subunit